MEQQQGRIHQQRGGYRLQNAYYESLTPRLFQLGQAELVAYGKGYEAQSHIAYEAQALHLLITVKAQTRYVQRTYEAGPYEHTRYQICRHVRQVQIFYRTGHHQPGKHRHG